MLRGGRIRGQGTYGCVFQPALLCRGKPTRTDYSKVGKITGPNDAHNELEIARYLETIPNSSNYTVAPESESCVPRARSRQTDTDIQQCEFATDLPLEKTIQITMPWGGYPLSQLNLDPKYFDFYKFTEDILAIGTFILLNDLCHFDIWGQNFLFDRTNKPKLIDYGFAFRPSKLTIDDLHMRWRVIAVDHDTETPDVTLMLGVQHGLDPSSLAHQIQLSKPAVQRLTTLCNVSPAKWAAELVQWSQDSQSFQQHDWLSCWKLYWPGFDAWSIGALLLQVLEIQMSIPSFTQTAQWKERGPAIKDLMRGLCRGHPAYRLDAAEALKMWTSHPLIADGSPGSDWVSQKRQQRQQRQL